MVRSYLPVLTDTDTDSFFRGIVLGKLKKIVFNFIFIYIYNIYKYNFSSYSFTLTDFKTVSVSVSKSTYFSDYVFPE